MMAKISDDTDTKTRLTVLMWSSFFEKSIAVELIVVILSEMTNQPTRKMETCFKREAWMTVWPRVFQDFVTLVFMILIVIGFCSVLLDESFNKNIIGIWVTIQ